MCAEVVQQKEALCSTHLMKEDVQTRLLSPPCSGSFTYVHGGVSRPQTGTSDLTKPPSGLVGGETG